MFNIFDEQVIRITRGNSADISIKMTDRESGEPIAIGEGDSVLFTVKNQNGDTVIKKVLTESDLSDDGYSLLISILPEETLIQTGEYPYDVLYIGIDGSVVTFISSTMVITNAVGIYTDVGGDA